MTRFRATFRSLHEPNYRIYFVGMAVSAIGTWMQLIAQGWLVLQLSDSGVALGVVTALQFGPMLLAGAWGGVLADRMDKRQLVLRTQVASAVLALVLGLADAAGVATLGLVYVLAFLLGCVNAVDNPARRSFVAELVDPSDVPNAVALNTAMFTTSRAIGPAVAGLVIAAVGTAACFLYNAASFAAVVVALLMIDPSRLRRSVPEPRAPGQVRAGLRYAWTTPEIRLPLLTMAVISTLALEFQVVLPLLADRVFDGGPAVYGTLFAVLSVGSLLGALLTAGSSSVGRGFLLGAATLFGLWMIAAAAAPNLTTELVVLVPMGAAGTAFISAASSILQVHTRAELRGRVMALYSVVFLGSTTIGGPIVGALAEVFGARSGFYVGGVSTLLTVGAVLVARRPRPAPVEVAYASNGS